MEQIEIKNLGIQKQENRRKKRMREYMIKDKVMEVLGLRPMTTYELATKTGLAYKTVKHHLQDLQALNVVRQSNFHLRDQTQQFWVLVR